MRAQTLAACALLCCSWSAPLRAQSSGSVHLAKDAIASNSVQSAGDAAQRTGHAVLVWAGAADDRQAWPLARELYALAGVAPPALREDSARALAGMASGSLRAEVRELVELRQAARDEGALSRSALREIGRRAGAELVLWVLPSAQGHTARVRWFWTERALLDATLFEGELGQVAFRAQVLQASARALGHEQPMRNAQKHVAASVSPPPRTTLPFLKSPWFWGALGVAAAGGVTLWLVSLGRDERVPVAIDATGVARGGIGTQAAWVW